MLSRKILARFNSIDKSVTAWMGNNGIAILRICLGIIFVWFGAIKFFPGLSSAEALALNTIQILTFGFVPPKLALVILACWETLIGVGLITRIALRAVIFLLLLQMAGTLSPLFLFPHETFIQIPFVPTLEGQYIIKNLVLISAALVVGATVRGGALIADPKVVKKAGNNQSRN